MSGPGLLEPWGLMALASLAAVAVIYLFYQRHRTMRVSGLFLWDAPEGWHEGGRRLSILRVTRSLLLDLVACALVALAVARPAWISGAERPLVIVMDASLSMRSGANHERAREGARALLGSVGRFSAPVVIAAGSEPRMLAGPGAGRSEALLALDTYDPFDPEDGLEEALVLAREVVTGRADVHVWTDRDAGLVAPAGTSLTTHVLAGRAPNVAIVDAVRHVPAWGTAETAILSVASFAERDAGVDLVVRSEKSVIHDEHLTLGPGEIRQVVLDVPGGTGPLEVVAAGKRDALAEDSRVILLPEPSSIVTYGIDVGDAATADFVRRALDAAGAVAAGQGEPDLLIARSDEARGRVATMRLARAGGKGAALLGPYVVDLAHPLCTDLDLTGVYWTTGPDPTGAGGMPLVSVGDRSLYVISPDGVLVLDLDPGRSNIVRTAAWPVLVADAVRWVSARIPGIRRSNYRPREVPVLVPHAEADANPARIEGGGVEIPWERPSLPPRLPSRPGRYLVIPRSGSPAEIAINAIAPAESDLGALAAETRTLATGEAGIRAASGASPLGWILVVLALSAAILNWALDRRRARA